MTRLMWVVSSIICLASLSGCKVADKLAEVHLDDGAVLKGGINPKVTLRSGAVRVLDGGINPNFQFATEAIKVLDGGINPKLEVAKGAFTVEPGAFPKALIEQGAVQFKVEPGAITLQPGAITINIGGKGPALSIDDVETSLKNNLKPLDLKGVDEKTVNAILSNEKVYQDALNAILKLVVIYNKTNTTGVK